MKYFVDVATKKNTKEFSKPNEDFAFADSENGIFIIMDGVTRDKIDGVYPIPSPAFEVSKIFTEKAHNYIKKNLEREFNYLNIIKGAFEEGNRAIKEFNHSYVGNFLPGTVGIIVILRENDLFYGYIGDCLGILLNEKISKEFTRRQTRLIHEHIKEFTADQIRNNICNNIGHPYSYGVLDGRIGAMDFIVTGKLSLDKYKGFLLLTDGAEEVVKHLSAKELLNVNVVKLLNKEINNQSTDDKTVILVRTNTNENILENS